jgi:hypothetical protein
LLEGLEADGEGAAAWNAATIGHGLPWTPCGLVAYYYMASRDFEDIDAASTAGMHGLGFVGFAGLDAALTAGGYAAGDLTVSWGPQDLGGDVDGVDWMQAGGVETRYYTGGTFEIKLGGEALVGGAMPRSTMTIDYVDVNNCLDDAISAVTDPGTAVDQSAGSSAPVQAAAAAFLADLGGNEMSFQFTSLQPAIQVELSGGGRSGAFFTMPNASITVEPVAPEPSDACSCIIGVFEADSTHDWSLVWTGASSPAAGEAVLKVVATSVNPAETGSIVVNITDDTGAKSLAVLHPATGENVDYLPLDLTAGTPYAFTVMTTGNAHHYRIGSENPEVAVGQMGVSYLEGVTQDWGARGVAGETVQLEITTDSADMGTNQANLVVVTVFDELTTALVYGPETRSLTLDTPEVFTFPNGPADRTYGVRVESDGHFRMTKVGGDQYLYALPCPLEEPVPLPGLSQWGLIAMAVLMGVAFLYTVVRSRRRSRTPA